MSKIELSADEIKVIHQQLNGEIEIYNATDEQQRLLSSVIEKADALLDETDAYDELEEQGNDLVQWFWNKYQEQQKQA